MTFAFFGSGCVIAMPKSLYLLMVARVLIGFAHGYAYLTVIVHGSEIMTQKLRGMIISALNFLTITSTMVVGTLTLSLSSEKHGFGSMQWIGIIGLIYSVMGILFTVLFTEESPVQLIRQKKYDQALALMVKVRNESTETFSIRNEYNELRTMVEEDEGSTRNICHDRNMRPVLLIALLKIGSVLSFNFGVNMVRLQYVNMFIDEEEKTNSAAMVFKILRMMTALVTMFVIDAKGRRPLFMISYVGTSICLMVMGIIVAFDNNAGDSWFMLIAQCATEIVGGFGIVAISDVYSSEAFSTMKKATSIAYTTGVEFLLHAVIIALTYNVIATTTFNWIFLVGSGVLVMAIAVFLHKKLPETAKMSIRQSRNEFLKSGEIVFSGSKIPAQNITFS